MDHAELLKLLTAGESDRIERTASLTDKDKFCQAICAFANDMPEHRQPGYLFVGVHDDGMPSGATIDDRALQNLAAIRSDGNIQPSPRMSVEKLALNQGEIAVVEVHPSDLPPVQYKGVVYIRVGPRRAVANATEERALSERRAALAKTWDARPCREATVPDLALDLFTMNYRLSAVAREVIEQNDRKIEEQLAALRFFDLRSGYPTNAGVLLFAKDPLYFFPGAYVQYVRYAGDNQATDPTQDRRFSGDLLTVMRGLDQLGEEIRAARPIREKGFQEREVFDYPPLALRELFMNAVIHRNYDGSSSPISINHFADRLEIYNPGGLYPDLTREWFPRGTAYRNPIVAEAAKVFGYVNRYGMGIAVAEEALRRNDSPPVRFEPERNHFLATVSVRP